MDRGTWTEIRTKFDFARAGKPMLVGMAAILVLVAVAAGYVLSGTATASEFRIEARSNQAVSEEAAADAKTVFVHVSGSVHNPGLYEIPEGSRVADAVDQAGGFADDADTESCNLARVLTDGEHVVIAAIGDAAGLDGASADDGATQATAAATLVNINTATASQLESLPGIGASTAQKIVAERTQNGPFKSVDDLMRVSGIGEKKLAAIADLVYV